MSKLKKCPFCGGKAHIMQMGFPHWVYCEDCGARVNGGTTDAKDSVAAWNRRVSEKPVNKCGTCKYLDITDKTHTVGYPCSRPNHYWRTPTAYLKQKNTIACLDYTPRKEGVKN